MEKLDNELLTKMKMPFCPGCGYNVSVHSISVALTNAGYKAHDVVLVSDIGCSGLVDPLFTTHTIHGLHGRSAALGLGISLGLDDPSKKVVAIQGDGGVTIGLQHLLEASRRNVNMTLVVMNNMVYGMTGGQISGLSSEDFKELKGISDDSPPFDICELACSAGAAYVARVKTIKKFEEILCEAFRTQGFSLVELPSMCQPYGMRKLKELTEQMGPEILIKNEREPFKPLRRKSYSLFETQNDLTTKYVSKVKGKTGIVIAGSAGGGIQTTAKLLTSAGIMSGLFATMKGQYPITVGTGFSMAEVILSETEIQYTGLDTPDVMIILSDDGMNKVKERIRKSSIVILDSSLDEADLKSDKVIAQDFVKMVGKKGAAMLAVAYWLNTFGSIKFEAFREVTRSHKYSGEFLRIIDQMKEPQFV